MTTDTYEYDVFISYAIEDKISIVTELVHKLKESGIRVWYAGHQLSMGHGVNETIKDGLSKSRHAVLILSHNYFSKSWPRREYNVLWSKENQVRKLLPIWHGVSEDEVKEFDATLANNYGIPSSEGVDHVVRIIVKTINDAKGTSPSTFSIAQKNIQQRSLTISIPLVLMTLASFIYYHLNIDLPPEDVIASTIEKRIKLQEAKINNDHQTTINTKKGKTAQISDITYYYEYYMSLKAQYRNEYYFTTGYHNFNYKKYVEPALELNLEALAPYDKYGFSTADMFIINNNLKLPAIDLEYRFINKTPIEYTIVSHYQRDEHTYTVNVDYDHHIRYLSVHLSYSKYTNWIKKRQTSLSGMERHETYVFKKENGQWVFSGVD
ncbi:toll/interleukin-1 receptor domain-containing protein [Fulvivirga sediminis]|uniref:Toll/interleukin-1 receptor domain-containing protein n=1 Tax=Fulvivirga sediminis TaxID=2803949 RepID=A0A937FAQ2_9BACT|nr:toll/interleukin-1 receptor domain-containing protein [Fulvivirga sediminis]MBL3657379.1 toll/interleukin-1 receptor domain-containing protein [Fulvivirga sediminis]